MQDNEAALPQTCAGLDSLSNWRHLGTNDQNRLLDIPNRESIAKLPYVDECSHIFKMSAPLRRILQPYSPDEVQDIVQGDRIMLNSANITITRVLNHTSIKSSISRLRSPPHAFLLDRYRATRRSYSGDKLPNVFDSFRHLPEGPGYENIL
jgi:hypothetical protein